MPRFRFARACLAALLLVAPAGQAQIVNIQPLVESQREPGFAGALDASADVRTGNTEFTLLGGSLILRWLGGPHRLFLIVRGETGVQAEARFVERDFEHLRYRYELLPWLLAEAFVQHDRDDFRRLALRALVGAGPRFVVVASERFDLALGLAYMYEAERLNERGDRPDAGEASRFHRASSYVSGVLRLDERLSLAQTVYYQPRLDDFGDARALGETELGIKLTELLTLKLGFTVAHDARPPSGLKPTDTTTKTTLQVRF